MSHMEHIRFRIPEKDRVFSKILALPVSGRPIKPRRNYACSMCRRSIRPLGRLPYPGFPTCSATNCEVTPLSAITKVFATPYGCAVHIDILSIFGSVIDLEERAFLQRSPLVDRADMLADAYIELLKWQRTFDLYERRAGPARYERGGVALVPPRRIDEVLAMRAINDPEPIDPTRRYTPEIQRILKRMYRDGSSGFEVPF